MNKPRSTPLAAQKIAQTVGAASGVVGSIGRVLKSNLSLPGFASRHSARRHRDLGASPGIESMPEISTPPAEGKVRIRCVDYAPAFFESFEDTQVGAILARPRPEDATVRWINVDGLHPYVVDQIKSRFGIHTLAAEDVLRTPQRPKVNAYEDSLFVVMRMLMLTPEQNISHNQVSFFLFKDTLITFQEHAGDVWEPVRERLRNPGSRLREQDPSYLLYTLLDAVVDHCFPVLEQFGDHLEVLEDRVVEDATPALQQEIHQAKRELSLLRRVIWPTREVISHLMRDETAEMTPFAKTYMRDVYDHTIQVMDVVETYREMAGGLNDLFMSAVSNRMNEIMKVLTIMASFFIPVTFVAGVYGMNFEYIPELSWRFSYAAFWLVCLSVVGGLAFYFWRKGWIGRG